MKCSNWSISLCIIVLVYSGQVLATGWDSYKQQFITAEGRVVDTSNNNVSHTESQGYGMLLAVANNDKTTFNTLWQWTKKNLANPINGLFYWRYTPGANNPTMDKNNAADGDVLIAWALQRAAQKWQQAAWQQQSDALQQAIVQHNVVTYAGRTVMLPAAQGFNKASYVVLNPSYFLFAAWRDFSAHSHLQVWNQLISDGLDLLGNMQFGNSKLPLDWVALNADGTVAPAINWPPRFSYDAIRVPLNLWWFAPKNPLLTPYQTFWGQYARTATPAWIDLQTNMPAPYMMDNGLLAVRDLIMDQRDMLSDTLAAGQTYYSASLTLLVWLALQDASN